MSKREKSARVSTSGGAALGQNPFDGLSGNGLPPAEPKKETTNGASPNGGCAPSPPNKKALRTSKGRVEIRRVKAGRSGKTVTLISGFVGIASSEKETLCKTLRQACGCGGTVNASGAIEIQGDQRERIAALLREKGFQPVLAGG